MDITLILSIIVLLAAPVLSRLVAGRTRVQSALDGFVLVSIMGLVFLTLLPEAIATGGWTAVGVALLGLFLPWISEALIHRSEAMVHRALIIVAALALVAHAASDGAILKAATTEGRTGDLVAAGVILHRIGVGLAIWWLLSPILTSAMSYVILLALGATTVVGYLLMDLAMSWYGLPFVGVWQAFAAGSLMHVLLHPVGETSHSHSGSVHRAHQGGTLLGLVFILLLIAAHYLSHSDHAITGTAHGHEHHAMDLLMEAGSVSAPLLLAMLVAALVWGFLRNSDSDNRTLEIWRTAGRMLPWTVLVWLAVAWVSLTGASLPFFPEGKPLLWQIVLFAIWTAFLCHGLVRRGARRFFRPLLPARLLHDHDHDHSHSEFVKGTRDHD